MIIMRVTLSQCNNGDKLLEQRVDSKVSVKSKKMSLTQRR